MYSHCCFDRTWVGLLKTHREDPSCAHGRERAVLASYWGWRWRRRERRHALRLSRGVVIRSWCFLYSWSRGLKPRYISSPVSASGNRGSLLRGRSWSSEASCASDAVCVFLVHCWRNNKVGKLEGTYCTCVSLCEHVRVRVIAEYIQTTKY